MKGSSGPETGRFIIRVGITVAALLLVLYVARELFWKQVPSGLRWREGIEEKRSYPPSPREKTEIISWKDAENHYGEYRTVEGKVVATHNSGKACFLNFHPDYKKHFTAVIFASAFPRFPANPENYYSGKTVRVTGYIKEYMGKPEIILNDPSQIEIIE